MSTNIKEALQISNDSFSESSMARAVNYCGLDFGTSNCSIGYSIKKNITLFPLEENSVSLPSHLYVRKAEIKISDINEGEVQREISRILNSQSKSGDNEKLSKEQIGQRVRRRFKAEAISEAHKAYEALGITSLTPSMPMVFGSEAILSNAKYPDDGIYSKSPKTFLGSNLSKEYRESFQLIVERFLGHIKQTAMLSHPSDLKNVVIGRPVNFSNVQKKDGNFQALEILEKAAKNVGFQNVEFEYEPVAAALDFERSLTSEKRVLVVDIGGGTTDVTMMSLCNKFNDFYNRSHHVIGSAGKRIGGNDIDIALSISRLCVHLGKESLANDRTIINKNSPLSVEVYNDACKINDINRLRRFRSSGGKIDTALSRSHGEMRIKLNRMQRLHSGNLAYRFNRSAELAKIALSSKHHINLPLKYLDDSLTIELDIADLKAAIEVHVYAIRRLMTEVINQAGTLPDLIYFTGGSAKSPALIEMLVDSKDRHRIVSGDQFMGVASGLAIASENRFS